MGRLRRNWLVRALFYRRRIWALLYFATWFSLLVGIAQEYDLAAHFLNEGSPYVAATWVGISLFGIVGSLLDLLRREDRWANEELRLIRELAQAGHVLFPAPDGGYDVYGPDGSVKWLDHWWEVEEYATSHRNVSHLPGSGALD